jgi:hypothetical protein
VVFVASLGRREEQWRAFHRDRDRAGGTPVEGVHLCLTASLGRNTLSALAIIPSSERREQYRAPGSDFFRALADQCCGR